ncbi:hypothetical protein [Streptomyces sp. NPDC091259]|uniref:hypothetical protein n=1 Tax=Streptomyces sp. NPDC091259 TaxID=3365976 RepID=UPI0037F47516
MIAMERVSKQSGREAVTDLELRFIEAVEHGRVRAEITYEQLGRYLGLSKSQVSKRQDGQIKYAVRDMYYVGRLFDIDPLTMAAGLGDWLNNIKPEEVQARIDDLRGSDTRA